MRSRARPEAARSGPGPGRGLALVGCGSAFEGPMRLSVQARTSFFVLSYWHMYIAMHMTGTPRATRQPAFLLGKRVTIRGVVVVFC